MSCQMKPHFILLLVYIIHVAKNLDFVWKRDPFLLVKSYVRGIWSELYSPAEIKGWLTWKTISFYKASFSDINTSQTHLNNPCNCTCLLYVSYNRYRKLKLWLGWMNETIKCFNSIISIALLDFSKCLLL